MDEIAKKYKTWIEVDRSAIKHNYETFRKLLKPETKLMAVVKSNAYGHDLVQFSKECQDLGADFFAVDEAREAFILQDAGITKPILILNYIEEDLLQEVVKRQISFVVSNFNILARAIALKSFISMLIRVSAGSASSRKTKKNFSKFLLAKISRSKACVRTILMPRVRHTITTPTCRQKFSRSGRTLFSKKDMTP